MSEEADRLKQTHPNHADDIIDKQNEIEKNWERLRDQVNIRKNFHNFLCLLLQISKVMYYNYY